MSDYLYSFLSSDAGSIAHYDKNGWLSEYPTVIELKHFYSENENGCNIVQEQPYWKSDVILIGQEILKLLNSSKNETKQDCYQISMFG